MLYLDSKQLIQRYHRRNRKFGIDTHARAASSLVERPEDTMRMYGAVRKTLPLTLPAETRDKRLLLQAGGTMDDRRPSILLEFAFVSNHQ